MNKKRRAELDGLAAQLVELRTEVQSRLDDEQDYFDNMPEALRFNGCQPGVWRASHHDHSTIYKLSPEADHEQE